MGEVITSDGRSKVMSDPKGDNLPLGWLPQPFNDVNDDPSALNEEACLIAFGSNEAMHAAVKTVAEEYYANAGKDIDSMPFRFYKGPDGGGFYVCEKDAPTPDVIREFLSDYQAKKLERQ